MFILRLYVCSYYLLCLIDHNIMFCLIVWKTIKWDVTQIIKTTTYKLQKYQLLTILILLNKYYQLNINNI